jgi:putative addiction module component (TIGR02574 family)
MNLSATLDDIKRLDVNDRLLLVQAIWDTIDEESVPVDLTDGQKADLSRRMKELDENPSIGLTWEQLKARLQSSK